MPDTASRVRYHQVDPDEAGQRIDNFLLRQLKGLPRSRIYRLLRKGEVRVDGGRAKPTRRLAAGEVVRIPPLQRAPQGSAEGSSEVPRALAQRLRRGILYEDDRLLILDKPSGLAVHGGSTVRLGLIEALRKIRPDLPFVELAHRLDQETSGCLMLGKRRSTLRRLHAQIRDHRVEKRYTALLQGRLETDHCPVDAPLLRLPGAPRERQVRVDPDGRPARTEFRVLQRWEEATLVEARLETGRTHQIRVHARHLGHPVAGDERYGERCEMLRDAGLRRLFLHASKLQLNHPETGESISVEAPLDETLTSVLEHLGPAAQDGPAVVRPREDD